MVQTIKEYKNALVDMMNPDSRNNYSKNSKQRYEKVFSIKQVVEEYCEVYEKINL